MRSRSEREGGLCMQEIDVMGIKTVITGASGVIGIAFAEAFLEHGAYVANWDLQESDPAKRLAQRFPQRYLFCETDVCREDSIEKAARETAAQFGGIDALCNIAGIIAKQQIGELETDTLDRLYKVNVRGLMLVTKRLVPMLKKSGRGRIINMSSIQAAVGMETYSPYTFTKAAVSGVTRVWALELAPYGVTVNAICPGWAKTAMADQMVERLGDLHGISTEEARELILSYVPQRRFIDPQEIAFTGLFLASSAAGAISANEIFVDAGMAHCAKPGLNLPVPETDDHRGRKP